MTNASKRSYRSRPDLSPAEKRAIRRIRQLAAPAGMSVDEHPNRRQRRAREAQLTRHGRLRKAVVAERRRQARIAAARARDVASLVAAGLTREEAESVAAQGPVAVRRLLACYAIAGDLAQ